MCHKIIQRFPSIRQNFYKVRIGTATYNQSKYIRECLDGIAMQKTNFHFVHHIIDDCSTDGEQNIIRRYIECNFESSKTKYFDNSICSIIYSEHKTNHNYTIVVYFLKKNMYFDPQKRNLWLEWQLAAEFSASCEGDDYWTDPLKLQKQIDALEKNPQCTISIGLTKTINADGSYNGGQIPLTPHNLNKEFTLEDFCREQFSVGQWIGHTSTFLYRTNITKYTDECMKNIFGRFPYGDICIILCCLLQGNGVFINEHMSNYRLMSGGFNSKMKANPDKAIAVEYKLIDGMNDFDAYTEYKYHRYIEKRILRSECIIEFLKGGRNGFVFLKPKYLPIAKMQGWKNTFLMVLQTMFPHLYPKLKKLIKS